MDGAEDRFERLWRDNAPAVLRFACLRVPQSDVDDVVAETFAVAWRRLDEVPARALPWLLGVARNVGANAVRASRRRDALHLRVIRLPAADVEPDVAELVDVELDPAAAEALARLPERDRELLTLLAWNGLTHQEAADVVGCSRGVFDVRLHRARARFRTHLLTSTPRDPGTGAGPASSHPQPASEITGGTR